MTLAIYPQALVLGAAQEALDAALARHSLVAITRYDTAQTSITMRGWLFASDIGAVPKDLLAVLQAHCIPHLTIYMEHGPYGEVEIRRAHWESPHSATDYRPFQVVRCSGDEAFERGWLTGSPYGVEPTAHQRLQAITTPSGVVPRPMP